MSWDARAFHAPRMTAGENLHAEFLSCQCHNRDAGQVRKGRMFQNCHIGVVSVIVAEFCHIHEKECCI